VTRARGCRPRRAGWKGREEPRVRDKARLPSQPRQAAGGTAVSRRVNPATGADRARKACRRCCLTRSTRRWSRPLTESAGRSPSARRSAPSWMASLITRLRQSWEEELQDRGPESRSLTSPPPRAPQAGKPADRRLDLMSSLMRRLLDRGSRWLEHDLARGSANSPLVTAIRCRLRHWNRCRMFDGLSSFLVFSWIEHRD